MFEYIQRLGEQGITTCANIGRSGIFLAGILFRSPRLGKSVRYILSEIYMVGWMSLAIIVVSGMFIGMVVSLQGHNTLDKFGATSQLGQLLALTITRELGPVVTALLFAGRAGSALSAEIALMKTTMQLSSMEMMGVDPLWRVIFPRFWAGVITMPILAVIFSAVAVYGGYLVGVPWLGIDAGAFWSNMQSSVDYTLDIRSGIIKSVVFGFIATWIAVYQGYHSVPTAQGIATSTTKTVVYSSLAILGIDFVLTAMMMGGW